MSRICFGTPQVNQNVRFLLMNTLQAPVLRWWSNGIGSHTSRGSMVGNASCVSSNLKLAHLFKLLLDDYNVTVWRTQSDIYVNTIYMNAFYD